MRASKIDVDVRNTRRGSASSARRTRGLSVRMKRTVEPSAAAELLGISPQLTRWRAQTGKIPVWRRAPLRFRVVGLLAAPARRLLASASRDTGGRNIGRASNDARPGAAAGTL